MPVDKNGKDDESPETTSFAWDTMSPRWDKMAALMGGTEAMRDRGTRYLPQHPAESIPAYEERLQNNVLFNMTELTLDALVGRPFSDPIKLSEDMPPQIKELAEENIDLQGNNLSVFLREWFREGLSKALCHVMVEFPRLATEEELGRPRTMEDDRREGLRPYWVLVKPENVIFAHAAIINGQEVLRHIRIRETIMVQDGFRETPVDRIRQLDAGMQLPDGTVLPTSVTIWEQSSRQKGGEDEWIVVDQFEIGVSFIPVVTFYTNREGLMEGKPPLMDLGDLNIRHWQSYADQISVLTVARYPMLAVSGGTDADSQHVGPMQVLVTPDPDGRWYYVEHSGKAIQAGREEMQDLVEQMSQYGAQFLRKRPAMMTATARAMDSAEATSPLQDMTVRFMDAVQTALTFTAIWLRLDQGGTIEMSTEFGPEEALSSDIDAIRDARKERDISRQQANIERKRRGILRDKFEEDENERELEEEAASMLADQPKIEIDAGAEE